MKIKTKIDNKEVTIVLTKEQLSDIKKQTSDIITVENINSYKDACKILKRKPIKCSPQDELFTIIEAVNFLDNNNSKWNPDFDNINSHKCIPYFKKISSNWVLLSVDFHFGYSSGPVGFFFKSGDSAKLIAAKFIKLYNTVLG